MDLKEFLARRLATEPRPPRPLCGQCRKAVPTCYCHVLRPFEAPLPFVILQHSDEARNPIATARMAHLSMTNSELIVDRSFQHHERVQVLLADPTRRNVLLYPSPEATPLETLWDQEAKDPRQLTFWVLDAKWSQVAKMLRLSPDVKALPAAAFRPDGASQFRIRKQPRPAYVSTIEAIYLVIDRYLRHRNDATEKHQALLDVFQHLVRQQLTFVSPGDQRHARAKRQRAERRRHAKKLAAFKPQQFLE